MTNTQKATIQVVVGASLISFAAVLARISQVEPSIVSFYRMLFGGTILLLISLFYPGAFAFRKRDVLLASLCGALFACDLSIWHRSINYIGPGLATILANFQVFGMALYGTLILKEKASIRLKVSVPLAFLGLLMIVGLNFDKMKDNYKIGLLLGLSTAGFYTTFLVLFRKIETGAILAKSIGVITIVSFTAALTNAIIALTTGESFAIPNLTSATILVAYAIVGQVLAWVVISVAISRVPASRVGLLLLMQPTLAFLWDILFFHRPTDVFDFIGAAIALFAIYLGGSSRAR